MGVEEQLHIVVNIRRIKMNKEELLKEKAKIEAELKKLDETQVELFWNKYTIENIEEAKKDSDWNIRREAYRMLGFTDEAKKDSNWTIRLQAELYFKIKEAKEKLMEMAE